MRFKVGDRVWFEGRKYTLEENADGTQSIYPLCLSGNGELTFTVYGRMLPGSHKPSIKLVKKKNRRKIWLCEKSLSRIGEIGFSSWTGDGKKPVHEAHNGGDWVEFIEVRNKK